MFGALLEDLVGKMCTRLQREFGLHFIFFSCFFAFFAGFFQIIYDVFRFFQLQRLYLISLFVQYKFCFLFPDSMFLIIQLFAIYLFYYFNRNLIYNISQKKCYFILAFQLYLAFSFFQIFHVVLILDFFEFSINQQITDFVFFLQPVKIMSGLISFFCYVFLV